MATSPKKKTSKTSTRSMAKPRTTSRRKSAPAKKSTKPRSTSRKSAAVAKTPAPTESMWSSLSPERKMDIIGIVLAVVGLLTTVSLFSNEQTPVTGWWAKILFSAVGWGAVLLALGMIALGAWMALRKNEKLPKFSGEKVIGLLLIFFNLVIWINIFSDRGTEIKSEIFGGGIFGAFFEKVLVNGLGITAAVIALLGWLLIGMILAFDLSLADLSKFVQKQIQEQAARWENRPQSTSFAEDDVEFTKVQPDLEESQKDMPDAYRPIQDLNGTKDKDKKPEKTGRTKKEKEQSKQQPETAQPAQPVVQRVKKPKTIWKLPEPAEILEAPTAVAIQENVEQETARLIETTLASFGVPGHVVDIKRGPTVTQYGLEPDFIETRHGKTRVRVNKITALADDLALALAAARIRIQAPVPGKSFVGIEVPNKETSRVTLQETLKNSKFKKSASPLVFGLGKNVSGKPIAVDLASLPHLLIAGTTGSGKSVCVNAILTSFLLHNSPDDLKLVLVDPKRVELTGYNGIPHLLSPAITDAEKVINALQWMTREMDSRYHKFSKTGVRNITEYNSRNGDGDHLPYIVVVIDELADLMMLAPDETERTITRLAQLARATGIHLVLATQRPSTDVVTGLIKANFPARIAFAVASGVDSRVILDQPGAERLLGRGDMLFQAPDASAPVRLQGVFVSDQETQKLVNFWKESMQDVEIEQIPNDELIDLPRGVPLKQDTLFDESPVEEPGDKLLPEAVDLVRREGRASITMLQRKLRIGYTRAARLIDVMEDKGIITGVLPHTNVREILDYGPTAPPQDI